MHVLSQVLNEPETPAQDNSRFQEGVVVKYKKDPKKRGGFQEWIIMFRQDETSVAIRSTRGVCPARYRVLITELEILPSPTLTQSPFHVPINV